MIRLFRQPFFFKIIIFRNDSNFLSKQHRLILNIIFIDFATNTLNFIRFLLKYLSLFFDFVMILRFYSLPR